MSAPVRVAHTSLGAVGYCIVGSGPPLVMVTGYPTTMEAWPDGKAALSAKTNPP
jgi:hypothetical protein